MVFCVIAAVVSQNVHALKDACYIGIGYIYLDSSHGANYNEWLDAHCTITGYVWLQDVSQFFKILTYVHQGTKYCGKDDESKVLFLNLFLTVDL